MNVIVVIPLPIGIGQGAYNLENLEISENLLILENSQKTQGI